MLSTSYSERFWSKVDIRSPDECWPWMAAINSSGYGSFGLDDKIVGSHIIAFKLSGGKHPKKKAPTKHGWCTLHSCDNPPCCNPAHLFSGSQPKNIEDRNTKGRNPRPKAESHYNARLTWNDVRLIRKSPETDTEMAKQLGVSSSHIHKIRLNLKWKEDGPDVRA